MIILFVFINNRTSIWSDVTVKLRWPRRSHTQIISKSLLHYSCYFDSLYSGLIVINSEVDVKVYIYRYGADLPGNPDFIYTFSTLHVWNISAMIDIDRNIFYVMWFLLVPFGTFLSSMLKFEIIYFYQTEHFCLLNENKSI